MAAIRKHRRGGPSEKVIEKQRKLKEEDDYYLNILKQANWPNLPDKLPRNKLQRELFFKMARMNGQLMNDKNVLLSTINGFKCRNSALTDENNNLHSANRKYVYQMNTLVKENEKLQQDINICAAKQKQDQKTIQDLQSQVRIPQQK